jgi:hypothetical protein
MTGVQLIGKKAVLARYAKLDCEAWALYQGKQFIVGGAGAEDLEGWLTDFEQSGTTAIYTMRVYDCEEIPTSGKAGADYIACVHFKVVDTYDGMGVSGYGNKMGEEIAAIKNQLKKLTERGEEPEEQGGIGAIVTDWLNNPEKLAVIFGIAKQFFTGGSAPAIIPVQPIQKISGFTMSEQPTINASSPEGLERISKALDTLGQCDPDLVRHLEKLATLAVNEPLMFKAVIGKLDGL